MLVACGGVATTSAAAATPVTQTATAPPAPSAVARTDDVAGDRAATNPADDDEPVFKIPVGKSPVPKIDVHTRNGDITLALPGNAEFQIDGSTSQGDADNEFGGGLEQHSNGHTATIKGHVGNGPLLTVGTDRGMLSVKKS